MILFQTTSCVHTLYFAAHHCILDPVSSLPSRKERSISSQVGPDAHHFAGSKLTADVNQSTRKPCCPKAAASISKSTFAATSDSNVAKEEQQRNDKVPLQFSMIFRTSTAPTSTSIASSVILCHHYLKREKNSKIVSTRCNLASTACKSKIRRKKREGSFLPLCAS